MQIVKNAVFTIFHTVKQIKLDMFRIVEHGT